MSISLYDRIVDLARRRGFFWPSSEIYGGVSGFIDFGPLGFLLKKNIEEKWRKWFILRHQDFIYEIETPIIMPERVFEASGHLQHFTDTIVECLNCRRKFRADHLIEVATGLKNLEGYTPSQLVEIIRNRNIKCPECGGELSDVRTFLLLFKTNIGPYNESIGYARPEAAQGMFTTFMRIFRTQREKLPIGIAQVGKVLRNEISPRQGLIRLREFTIMELELFFDKNNPSCDLINEYLNEKLRLLPEVMVEKAIEEGIEVTVDEALKKGYILNPWNAYFMVLAKKFILELGVSENKQRFVAKLKSERAHYSAQTYDQQVLVDKWGWIEVSGHAYRTDYDLRRHMIFSGQEMYVHKKLSHQMDVEVIEAIPKIDLIKEKYPKDFNNVIKILREIDSDFLKKALDELGKYNVKGFEITRDIVEFKASRTLSSSRKFIPNVAEPSFGLERLVYIVMENAYSEVNNRVVLKLPRDIAPIQVIVLPLVNRGGIPEKAIYICKMLRNNGFITEYDDKGSIGRRYARADEIGIPVAITIDGQTLEDNTVTVRDRDTWKQVRVRIDELPNFIKNFIEKGINI
ncbi:MAG: glycine--tRNA ligase [Candidatus Methanomethylicia archaeon]